MENDSIPIFLRELQKQACINDDRGKTQLIRVYTLYFKVVKLLRSHTNIAQLAQAVAMFSEANVRLACAVLKRGGWVGIDIHGQIYVSSVQLNNDYRIFRRMAKAKFARSGLVCFDMFGDVHGWLTSASVIPHQQRAPISTIGFQVLATRAIEYAVGQAAPNCLIDWISRVSRGIYWCSTFAAIIDVASLVFKKIKESRPVEDYIQLSGLGLEMNLTQTQDLT